MNKNYNGLFLGCMFSLLPLSCGTDKNEFVHTIDTIKEYAVVTDSLQFSAIAAELKTKFEELKYKYISAASDSQFIVIHRHLCKSNKCTITTDTSMTFNVSATIMNFRSQILTAHFNITKTGFFNTFAIDSSEDMFAVWNLKSTKLSEKKLITELDSLGRFYSKVLGWNTYIRDILAKKGNGYLISYTYMSDKALKKNIVWDPYINLFFNFDYELQWISFGR